MLVSLAASATTGPLALAQVPCEPDVIARCTWVETRAAPELAFLLDEGVGRSGKAANAALETHRLHHGWPVLQFSEPDRVPLHRRASCPSDVLDQIENLATVRMRQNYPTVVRFALALQRNGRADAAKELIVRQSMDLHTEMWKLADLAEAEGDFALAFARVRIAGFPPIVCEPPGARGAFDLRLARLAARARLWDATDTLTERNLFRNTAVPGEFLCLWTAAQQSLGRTRDPREEFRDAVGIVGPYGKRRFAAALRSHQLARLDDEQLKAHLVELVRGDFGNADRAFRILVDGGQPLIESTLQEVVATWPTSDNANIADVLAMLGNDCVAAVLLDRTLVRKAARPFAWDDASHERWRALTDYAR